MIGVEKEAWVVKINYMWQGTPHTLSSTYIYLTLSAAHILQAGTRGKYFLKSLTTWL